MCRECGTVIMEDDAERCPDCEVKYTESDLTAAIEAARKEERERKNREIAYLEMCISQARVKLSKGEIIESDLLLYSGQQLCESVLKMGDK